MYQIVQKRKWWYGLSFVLSAVSIVFIALGGLRLGIDFTGGTLIQMSFTERPTTEQLLEVIRPLNIGEPRLQTLGETNYNIRLGTLDDTAHQQLNDALVQAFPGSDETSFEVVGPVIGAELRQKAVTAIIFVLSGIVLYVMWAFRASGGSIPSWKFGLNTIIALVHDIVVTIGFFAALGYFFGVEIDILFITALLTILGFSVHDTIVVFDRLREQLRVSAGSLEELTNQSINHTLVRSVNTSTTVMLVLLSLVLFGGESIRYFVLALLFGITIGTYSSIFLASPLIVTLSRRR